MRGTAEGKLIDVQAHRFAIAQHCEVGLPMAGQAVLVGESVRIENSADLVRSVAVDTGRDLVRFFSPQASFDHFAMHAVDLPVTGCAGCRHVLRVDARARILVRQDVVRGVAGCADRGYAQSLAKQTGTMDRERIVLENVILGDLASLGNLRSLLVTLAAQEWNVNDVRPTPLVPLRQDPVCAVTIGTGGCERVSPTTTVRQRRPG